jgi:hypothetical protein
MYQMKELQNTEKTRYQIRETSGKWVDTHELMYSKFPEDRRRIVSVPGERIFEWDGLTEGQQKTVALVHANGLKRKASKVLEIFNAGRPKIIFAADFSSCRIHVDSVEVITILTRQYL